MPPARDGDGMLPGGKPGDASIPKRPNADSSMGIGPENFESVFTLHRHDGSMGGGGLLYGPYFIKDAQGRPWKLVVSATGTLSTVKAF